MRSLTRTLALLFLALPLVGQQTAPAPAKAPAKPAAQKSVTPAKPGAAMPAPGASPAIALRGGRLLTITHGVIENGVIVMENGKITAVGAAAAVSIPKNARVIDVKGMTVYPGLIDSRTQLGLTEIEAVEMSNDLVEASEEIMPHMRVEDAFHAESELIPVTRMNGITNAVVTASARDTLPGQMSFIQLAGRDRDEMLLLRSFAMPLNFTGAQRRRDAGSRFPSTRMGLATQLRQAFIDAQDYAQKWTEFEKKSAEPVKDDKDSKDSKDKDKDKDKGKPAAPKRDLKFEALAPYLQGKKPVVLTAEESSDLKVALSLAREFNLKVILGEVTYATNMLDEIAATKLPVIVGNIFDTPKNGTRYDSVYTLPAELAKRGVKIAFASYDSHNSRNLPYEAGYAVAFGLPYEEALKALTINPAEIWGVADQLGSLDVGKTANVVVANGDPLDVKTDVKQVFIAGREIPMTSRQTQLRDAYSQR
ncbi:MAG TPA: amidohydrolase family protein [Terriglobales bacterium]|nr:amidohydrolase family protein [Terriglobales bacterium]